MDKYRVSFIAEDGSQGYFNFEAKITDKKSLRDIAWEKVAEMMKDENSLIRKHGGIKRIKYITRRA